MRTYNAERAFSQPKVIEFSPRRAAAASARKQLLYTDDELEVVRQAAQILEKRSLVGQTFFQNYSDVCRYLSFRFAGLRHEELHVLYLDQDDRLLEARVEATGSHKMVRTPIRQIVHRALTLGADKLVFAHNHPTGNALPSEQDMECLAWMESVLKPFDLHVVDSCVVTAKEIRSVSKAREARDAERWRREEEECARRRAERSARTRKRAPVAESA